MESILRPRLLLMVQYYSVRGLPMSTLISEIVLARIRVLLFSFMKVSTFSIVYLASITIRTSLSLYRLITSNLQIDLFIIRALLPDWQRIFITMGIRPRALAWAQALADSER